MKVTVETLGQFCAAQAADLSSVIEVLSVAGGMTSNVGVLLRMAAIESLEATVRDLKQASRDAADALGFDEVPEKPAVVPPAKVVHVKRGRKPKEKTAVEAVKPAVEMFPPSSVALSMAEAGARVLDDVEVSE